MPRTHKIKETEQELQNQSFDETFGVLVTEGLAYNPSTNTLDRVITPQEPVRVDAQSSGSVTTVYEGYVKNGFTAQTASSIWKIKKTTIDSTSGTTVAVTYADGDQNYDNVWDNRASLAYS